MLGALTSQMVSSRVIHNLNANDSLTANVETFRHKRPAVMPENLNAGEYLSLAEHYISIWNYKEAAKCIAKVKQLAPDSRLEESADQLEKNQFFTDKQFKKWLNVEKAKVNRDMPNAGV